MNLSKLYLNKFPTMKNYLPSFSVDEAKKLYLLLSKNSKCLLYKFNDWIELLGAEKNLIRHSSEAEDAVGLKREENDRQFLIEKIIYVEKENLYAVEMAKKQQILCLRLKKITELWSLFVDIADTFIQYINTFDLDEIEQLNNDLKPNCWGS